ncbi:MAG: hypothetical protein KBD60_03785 [Sterolibacterium sp.]|jgi:hypothetical protein|nr:hypothetical protein [Sterolibacterium sp.]
MNRKRGLPRVITLASDESSEKCLPEVKNKHRRKWRWFTFFLIGLAVPIIYVIWRVATIAGSLIYGFQSPEMAVAQYTPKDVVGDLGGMKMTIPRYYAEYVEYDGDPGFGEKRKGARPERTFDSRLRSFGMDVRFPDMKGLVDAQTREDKRRQPLREDSWLYVGITAGEHYPGDGSLDRLTNGHLFHAYTPESKRYWGDTYMRLPEPVFGLEAYVLSGTDPRTGKPARESEDTNDVYIHRLPSGKVDAFIDCGRTFVPGGVARCDMYYSLEPKAHVGVNASFRRGLLPEWQQIQQSSRELLLSFEVKDSSAGASRPEPAAPTSR